MGGDVDGSYLDSIGRLLNSLAFEGANIRTKQDVRCIQDVHMRDRAIGQQIAINNLQEVLGVRAPNDALSLWARQAWEYS